MVETFWQHMLMSFFMYFILNKDINTGHITYIGECTVERNHLKTCETKDPPNIQSKCHPEKISHKLISTFVN